MVYFIVFIISVDLNQYKKSYSRSLNRVLVAHDGHPVIKNNPKEIMLVELVLPSSDRGHQDCGKPEDDLTTTFAIGPNLDLTCTSSTPVAKDFMKALTRKILLVHSI